MRKMKDNPEEIAAHLIKVNGLEGALEKTLAGIFKSNAKGDNYSLSVWRDVRRIITNQMPKPNMDPEKPESVS